MKYLHKFSSFINESIQLDHDRREEERLTEAQQKVIEKLVEALDEQKPGSYNSTGLYADGTIEISYSNNITDWMDLHARGESIRMWVDEVAMLRPIFLSIGDMDQAELTRMKDLGLIAELSDYAELDGEYITGFNISVDVSYSSKDVQFEHSEGDNSTEFYSAAYLDINDNGPQEYADIAERLIDVIRDWFDETALRQDSLQELLDEEFPSYDEDEDGDEDEEENDEDNDDN